MKFDINEQKQFFDKKKNQYSLNDILSPPIHTKLEIQEVIDRIKKYKTNTVIDFGAGSGRITIALLRNDFSVLAVDISENSLLSLRNIANELLLTKLQVSSYIPKGKKYNIIVGADILHHIDLDTYLPLFYNSLNKGGRIIFSEPGGLNPTWYIYLPIFYDWNVEKGVINCTYLNLMQKLKRYKFQNIKITGMGFLPRPFFGMSEKICRLNDKMGEVPFLKLFAYRYIIEAEKK